MATFLDVLQSPGPTDVDKANRKDLGTLTLNQKGTMIRRVWAIVTNVGTKAQAKPLCGYITITSDDANVEPLEFPFSPTPPHLGATPHKEIDKPYKFDVNCPCDAGAVLQMYCTLGIAAPQGAPEVTVCVEYSDGETVGEGTQIHMKVLEPSGALSTGDGDVTTMSTIEIKNASKIIGVWAIALVATPVADEAVIVNCSITCDEFAESGPLKFPLRSQLSIDATTGWGGCGVTFIECERDLKTSTAVIQPSMTQYDANNAAPEAYVGVAYV